MDYSLARLAHYTATDPDHFQNHVLFTNYQFYVSEFEAFARRMLADIMLPMLYDRFPDMALPEPEKVQFWGFGFRGPLSLPVTLN